MDILDETTLQSPEAEAALLGTAAFHPEAVAAVLAALPGRDFYGGARGTVWEALRALSGDRRPIGPVAVARHLRDTGQLNDATRAVIHTAMADEQPAHHAPEHARVVADLARRRELVRAVKRAYTTVRDHPGDHSEILAAVRAVFDDLDSGEQRLGGTKTWPELLDEFNEAHAPDARHFGLPTPWAELDDLLGGLFGGRMYVIGGAAGEGKSTAAINIAAYAAQASHAVLVFSKEMPTLDVTGRIVAYEADINLAAINSRRLKDVDRERVGELRRKTTHWRLRVNSDPLTITDVKYHARALHHRGHLDLLVVDYLQLMSIDKPGRNREEEIARISTELKNLAMELAVPVVVPAQLNRAPNARSDMRPTKGDLRESGRIEQDADVVILLWRKPITDPHAGDTRPDPHHITFIVDKNRHGPKGEMELRWNGGYGRIG